MSRKEIEVCIQSSKYKIAPRVPVGAFLSTVQFINGTKDSKACVLFLLDELLKIENQHSEQVLPTQEEVNSTTDVELHRFLHAIIKNDSGITKYYRAQKKHESMYC
jgi:DNA repair ATPase RecN